MATSINVGDYFTVAQRPGQLFTCTKVTAGDYRIWSESLGFRPESCTPVRVTIRPVKTRRVKVRAWMREQEEWGIHCGERVDGERFRVWTGTGCKYAQAEGPTEAKAILALRKVLRAKGVKL